MVSKRHGTKKIKQVVTDHLLQRDNQSLDTAKARFFP